MDSNNVVLVTGATGHQGGAVATELLALGIKVRAMTRKPDSEKARALANSGAEIVFGDYDDPASLKKALDGVWGVFSVQNTWEAGVAKEEEQGKELARLAHKAGVGHFVYTSVASADKQTGVPHFDNKFRIEQTVRDLGFPSYTIIRPVFFMENWISPGFKPAIDQGNVVLGIAPDKPLQMIAVSDIGKYGAWAFTNHAKLNGRAIDIAGDELTMLKTAEIISSQNGKKVSFVRPPIEEVRKFSEDFAIMTEWFDRVGYSADIQGIAKESGIAPTLFADWAAKVKW
jgi:uncharacterized protein YbjT (DUF2867 family)